MVRCGSKNGNVFKEQYVYKGHWTTCSNLLSVLGSIVNIIGVMINQ